MKKKAPYFLLSVVLIFVYSCKKIQQSNTKICLHDSSVFYLKKWAIAFTQVNTYESNGSLKKSTVISPHGYFQINIDFTYNLYSDGVPVNGRWNINNNCEFVLNPNAVTERRFSIEQLSVDSLTISEVKGNTTYIEHYAAFKCPDLMNMEYRWDNVATLETRYSNNAIAALSYKYPTGYLKLNPDATYNTTNNDMPFKGTWGITQPGCMLVLDKNKPWEKSFDVHKITADSLVIWRKDTLSKTNYLQYYKRHN